MHMIITDEVLVAQAVAGDTDAFVSLLERHYTLIYRLSFRILGRKEAAEDLAQDVCISLSNKLRSFNQTSKFTTWLYRVVTNASLDARRKSSTREKAHENWAEVEKLDRARAEQLSEEVKWLYSVISQLSDDLRATAMLVVGEGLSYSEVGEVLTVPEGTISWRMSEVRKIIKAIAETEGSVK